MALFAEHHRNGEKISKNWTWEELATMAAIAEAEGNDLLSTGCHTVLHDFPEYGYQEGDTLLMWR